MKVVVVEPMKSARVEDIDPGLKSLQDKVGGYIEAIYPFDDQVALICNEEGKLSGLAANRALYDENGKMYDIIVGTFLVAGLTEEDFGDLTDELAEKYMNKYKHPQVFLKTVGGNISAFEV